MKTYLDMDVSTAAAQRLALVFDRFARVCVSFSGGKDSTVLVHQAAQEAARRGRMIDVLFIDHDQHHGRAAGGDVRQRAGRLRDAGGGPLRD